MHPTAVHKNPTQTVDSSQVFKKWNIQKKPKIVNKKTKSWEKNTKSWNQFVLHNTTYFILLLIVNDNLT